MSAADLDGFRCFFEFHPFDDLHRFHRPAALIASAFGGKYEDRLAFLAPVPQDPNLSDADRDLSKALGF